MSRSRLVHFAFGVLILTTALAGCSSAEPERTGASAGGQQWSGSSESVITDDDRFRLDDALRVRDVAETQTPSR